MVGLIIYVAIFVVWFVTLSRRRAASKSLPSRTKMLWAMVAAFGLAIVVQALERR